MRVKSNRFWVRVWVWVWVGWEGEVCVRGCVRVCVCVRACACVCVRNLLSETAVSAPAILVEIAARASAEIRQCEAVSEQLVDGAALPFFSALHEVC